MKEYKDVILGFIFGVLISFYLTYATQRVIREDTIHYCTNPTLTLRQCNAIIDLSETVVGNKQIMNISLDGKTDTLKEF